MPGRACPRFSRSEPRASRSARARTCHRSTPGGRTASSIHDRRVTSSRATLLLCATAFANTACVGVFSPLLPEIARAQSLADWQLGVLAGAFGFARMLADVPAGMLAARRLGVILATAPGLLALGVLLLGTAGPFPVLVLGRVVMGFGHTLSTVGGLTAILLDARGPRGSVRLNTYEFAGMAGVLGGLTGVGLLPSSWGWPLSLLVACSPLVISLALAPSLRQLPDRAAEADPRIGAPATATMRSALANVTPIVWLMFAMGIVMGL